MDAPVTDIAALVNACAMMVGLVLIAPNNLAPITVLEMDTVWEEFATASKVSKAQIVRLPVAPTIVLVMVNAPKVDGADALLVTKLESWEIALNLTAISASQDTASMELAIARQVGEEAPATTRHAPMTAPLMVDAWALACANVIKALRMMIAVSRLVQKDLMEWENIHFAQDTESAVTSLSVIAIQVGAGTIVQTFCVQTIAMIKDSAFKEFATVPSDLQDLIVHRPNAPTIVLVKESARTESANAIMAGVQLIVALATAQADAITMAFASLELVVCVMPDGVVMAVTWLTVHLTALEMVFATMALVDAAMIGQESTAQRSLVQSDALEMASATLTPDHASA